MASITRLTQLYDLEKVFSSTLEMQELLPLIGTKFSEILECEAVNIWLMLPDESVELMHQAGEDLTAFKGQKLKANEGIAGTISDNGEPIFIADAQDARLVERNREVGEEGGAKSLIAAAIMDKGALVGVVEAVNKLDGTPFDEDDLFTLSNLTETASTALHNASLLLAERKVEVLETLNTVSHEITSTLNLERMLQTIVNAPQAVIPYERAAIVLEHNGRFKLSAVTGLTEVVTDSPEIAPLNEILQWAALSEEVIHVRQHGEEIDAEREETRAKFRKYFSESGMRGFYARPLNDDTGRVGMLSMESSDPDFLGPAHLEIIEVLAGQATVALRNAQMYKEVPFISVLEPVLVRKRKFMAMQKRKRTAILVACGLGFLFLVACPLPLRVDGDADVAPGRRALVQPEVAGVISKVFVKEGEHVQRGQVTGGNGRVEFPIGAGGGGVEIRDRHAEYEQGAGVERWNASRSGTRAGGLLESRGGASEAIGGEDGIEVSHRWRGGDAARGRVRGTKIGARAIRLRKSWILRRRWWTWLWTTRMPGC